MSNKYNDITDLKAMTLDKEPIRIRLKSPVGYILAALLLLSCSSVYILQWNTLLTILIACVAFIYLVLIIAEKGAETYISKRDIVFIVIYIMMVLISSLVIPDIDISFYARFMIIAPVFMTIASISSPDGNRSFIVILSNVIYFMAISSLVLMVLGPHLGLIRQTSLIFAHWGWDRYYMNYCYLLLSENARAGGLGGLLAYRNLSIYPEGPFSSLVFTIGLASELFVKDHVDYRRIFVYYLAILSTISATGMILSTIMIALRYWMSALGVGGNESTSRKKMLRLAVSLLLVVLSSYLITLIVNEKQTNDVGNYSSHINAFANGFQAFLKHPIVGYGYLFQENMGNSTSGLFKVLIYGGLVLALLYIVPFIFGYINAVKTHDYCWCTFVCTIFLLIVLVIWQNSILCIAMMSIIAVGTIKESQHSDRGKSAMEV